MHKHRCAKKFECSFFDPVCIDAKSVLTFEKCPLVAEVKLKVSENEQFFMYSISALPPDGAFQISVHLAFIYCRVPARWGLQQTHPGLRTATRHGVRDPLVCLQVDLNFWVVLTDQRITGPESCHCLEPGWFVGDPIPLARDNIYGH